MLNILVFILIIIVIVLLIKKSGNTGNPYNNTTPQLNKLINEVISLKDEIRELKSIVTDINAATYKKDDSQWMPKTEQTAPSPIISEENEEEITEPALVIIENAVEEQIEEQFTPYQEPEVVLNAQIPEPTVPKPMATFTTPSVQADRKKVSEAQESRIDKWLRNNPDLEKFIGENLVNKIGIAVLVLGIAFFVKFAIDKDWINEVGRVCIGLGCGIILVGLAHFLRRNYTAFSSVLAGGGIAVFYFTIAFGFHQYHLMSQTAAFVIMVVITIFAILLSILYNKLELAIIATVGGFLAPFLVSTGEGNYIVLFTYLIILDTGILTLAYFKRWTSINIIALFFTEIIFGGWLVTITFDTPKQISYPLAILFASILYVIFLSMNLIHQLVNKSKFIAFDFIILLFISASYFAGGMVLMKLWSNGAYSGLFTLSLGIINLSLAWYVFKNWKADRNLLYMLIGITLTFLTLTIPIQLHGHAITMFWSAEFVLLYWLAEFSGIRIFKYSSLLICLLMLISLFMDWDNASSIALVSTNKEAPISDLLLIFINIKGITTNLIASAAFAVYFILINKNKEGDFLGINNRIVATIAISISVIILYITCIFGVNLYFHAQTNYVVPTVYYQLITEIFALGFLITLEMRKYRTLPLLKFVALLVCFFVFLFCISNATALRYDILNGKTQWIYFYVHWAASILFVLLFMLTVSSIRTGYEVFNRFLNGVIIILTLMAIYFISVEVLHVYVIACYRNNNSASLNELYNKAGLTVIWGLSSFALMWLGMKHGKKTLRIISLVLFTIVLLKLFILDISEISEGGKILAFILLGVLLLTVSFMYQKLKKIIIDDKKG